MVEREAEGSIILAVRLQEGGPELGSPDARESVPPNLQSD